MSKTMFISELKADAENFRKRGDELYKRNIDDLFGKLFLYDIAARLDRAAAMIEEGGRGAPSDSPEAQLYGNDKPPKETYTDDGPKMASEKQVKMIRGKLYEVDLPETWLDKRWGVDNAAKLTGAQVQEVVAAIKVVKGD